MALKASLVISGDAASATAALGQLDSGLQSNEKAATEAANAWRNADAAIKQLAGAQATAKREIDGTKAAFAAGEISLETYNRELLETKSALSLVSAQHQSAMTSLRASNKVMEGSAASVGMARAGYTQLGQQAQDVAIQLQMGTNIGTIIAQQGGQVATAVQMMGGRFSGLASFLAGPWGAAVLVGAGVLLNQLIPALFGASDAAEENANALASVEAASDGVSSAQSTMAGMFDLATGAISKQNDLLRANIALKAAQLKAEAMEARAQAQAAQRSAGQMSWGAVFRNDVPLKDAWDSRDTKASAKIAQVMAGTANPADAVTWAGRANFRNTNISREDFIDAILRAAEAGPKEQTADAMLRSLESGNLDTMFRKPTRDRPDRKRTPGKGPDIGEFGEDAAAKISRITDQFSDLPPVIARSNDAMRQLDDLASDLEKKKGPRYEELVGKLGAAREVIQASLVKPLDDYLEKASQTAAIDKLILGGKRDQAVALQDAIALQRQMGPLTEQQLAIILETVVAERQRGELLQQQQEMIGNYLDATRSVRGEIEAILSGQGKLSNLPQIFKNLQGRVLAEKLFGPMFRELDRWVQDDSGMKDATSSYIDSTRDTGKAAHELAAAFRSAGGQVREAASGNTGGSAFDQAFADIGGPADEVGPSEIKVVAERPGKPGSLLDISVDEYMRKMTSGLAGEFTDALNGALGTQFFSNFAGAIAGAMQGFLVGGGKFGAGLGLVRGLVNELGPSLLGNAGKGISDVLDKGFKGMATGAQISGLAGAFGVKLNSSGAQIGGAIGGALPIPGGAILGSIAGGLLGGLFKSSKKNFGTVSLAGVDQLGSVTSRGADGAGQAKGLGSGLQGALQSFADRLGGAVGAFDVMLGVYDGKYRVRTSSGGWNGQGGLNFNGASAQGLHDFGEDEGAAIGFALADAIADGAITGLSDRVQKAIKANSGNIDKALAEALKVQELEELLGGMTGTIDKAFASFERQAAERVRIATAYGFDLVQIEELNAKERLKLSKQLLEDQVGSLQRLIDEMTGGSLFEGSAVDRRTSLLEQIAKAKTDTDAGTEGAADRLAGLLEQLNAVSREVYGTTGGFAADRGAILDQARDAIARANQRIADAQKSDPALAQTNASLDENNDQNARLIAIGEQTVELLTGLSRGSTPVTSPRLYDLARTSAR